MASPATGRISAESGKGLNIAIWVVQILAAVAFLASGGMKLAGPAPVVAMFQKIGLGQWFRYFTALCEVGGAIALLVPGYAFYGASLLAAVMIGAIITHLAVLGGSPLPAIVLLVLTAAIAYFRRPR
jgi:uncharacterized membrane protein YphA (DoxX/SURF4 family)